MVPVAHGIDVGSLPGLSPSAPRSASTPETVSFIMDARNLNQLEWIVDHGVTHDLSVPQFAARYGQSPSVIAGLQGYLAHFGITTTQYPDGLDVSASGTAGEFDAALAVHQEQFHVPGRPAHDGTAASPAQTVHGAVGSPELPAGIAQNVLAILGLTNYAPFVTDLSTRARRHAGEGAGHRRGARDRGMRGPLGPAQRVQPTDRLRRPLRAAAAQPRRGDRRRRDDRDRDAGRARSRRPPLVLESHRGSAGQPAHRDGPNIDGGPGGRATPPGRARPTSTSNSPEAWPPAPT